MKRGEVALVPAFNNVEIGPPEFAAPLKFFSKLKN